MKLTLAVGTKNWSSWSLRAWLVMKATGLPFDEAYVRLRHDGEEAAVKRQSPSGMVPFLTVEDGGRTFRVWDSLAIAEFAAEIAPQAGLWPEDREARAVARAICAEMHSGFAELRRQFSMEFARVIGPTPPTPGTAAAVERISALWAEALSRSGGPFLFGPRFGIADAFYAPVVSRFRSYGVALDGAAEAWAARMWDHPWMREWLAAAEREVADGLA